MTVCTNVNHDYFIRHGIPCDCAIVSRVVDGKCVDGTFRPDPYPVGSIIYVSDHDGTTLGPYRVIRSYWPTACCELVDDDDPGRGMIRQNHDRILPYLPPERNT